MGQQQIGNFILDSLPFEEYECLRPHLKWVNLELGKTLVGVREVMTEVYFPVTGAVSLLNSTIEGDSVELGLIGREGVVGTTLFLNQEVTPWKTQVQLPGKAMQMSATAFLIALPQCPVLQKKLREFTCFKIVQLTQSALCNRFHPVEQRLCRWLLEAHDRAGTDELRLTRDILADMIGSARPAVSMVTGTLRTAGLIEASRGKVTILDRQEMEEASCECYSIVKQQLDTYLSGDRHHRS
jgi:CRP-like cAMP-binding protein